MNKNVKDLQDMISTAKQIVFFGGAGVSTESGIPDFRSAEGIYSREAKIPPETILSHHFFVSHTEEFFEFYRKNMVFPLARPNAAHCALAKLEECGKLTAVITQNIDGLHQLAGSKNVYELHGSIHRNHCEKCGKFFDLPYIMDSKGIPFCDKCGGVVKPDVVLYEEALDEQTCSSAIEAISSSDLLIVGGTSLSVYPAAGFVRYCREGRLVIINRTPTQYDAEANLLITEPIGEVFEAVCQRGQE